MLKQKFLNILNKKMNMRFIILLQIENSFQWKQIKDMSNKPKDFEYELANLNHINGWGKSLDGLSKFSVQNLQSMQAVW